MIRAENSLRCAFLSCVESRIASESHDSTSQGYLVWDFVTRCDAIFAEHNPETLEAVEALADSIDTDDLYELVREYDFNFRYYG